jgi:hypothetical protein
MRMDEIRISVAKTLGNIFMKNKIISPIANINFKSSPKCLFLVQSLQTFLIDDLQKFTKGLAFLCKDRKFLQNKNLDTYTQEMSKLSPATNKIQVKYEIFLQKYMHSRQFYKHTSFHTYFLTGVSDFIYT